MLVFRKIYLILLIGLYCEMSVGQQIPFNPVSYRIYSPFIINPAIAGSKDYFSLDVLAGFKGQSHSQILSGNTRITKKVLGYLPSGRTYSYTNIGTGFSGYNDYETSDSTHNAGISAAVAYHIPLSKKALSFLSVGVSVKGMYHFYEGNSDLSKPFKEFFFPNVDLGLYFYNPKAYAGLSVTNLLDPPKDTSTLTNYRVPVSRQYNFIAGYKIVLSRSLNLVLEPSILIHTDDSLSFDIKQSIEPALKLYAGNFCLGTYFNDYSKISFFFQYRYPTFYVGTYFALPKNSPFFKKSLTSEIAFGINFSHNKSGYTKNGHW
jgi:type IX secretion system PorP/SprF family membrane protein